MGGGAPSKAVRGKAPQLIRSRHILTGLSRGCRTTRELLPVAVVPRNGGGLYRTDLDARQSQAGPWREEQTLWGSYVTPGFAWHTTGRMTWSRRLAPTPGLSWMTEMLRSSSCGRGQEKWGKHGDKTLKQTIQTPKKQLSNRIHNTKKNSNNSKLKTTRNIQHVVCRTHRYPFITKMSGMSYTHGCHTSEVCHIHYMTTQGKNWGDTSISATTPILVVPRRSSSAGQGSERCHRTGSPPGGPAPCAPRWGSAPAPRRPASPRRAPAAAQAGTQDPVQPPGHGGELRCVKRHSGKGCVASRAEGASHARHTPAARRPGTSR